MVCNYQMSKIYKVWSLSTDKVYIGSTYRKYLTAALRGHVSAYNDHVRTKRTNVTSFDIIKRKDFDISLIEKYPCDSKDELQTRVLEVIKEYGIICVNKMRGQRLKVALDENPNPNPQKVKVNKEIITTCLCGGSYAGKHYSRHKRTRKHKEYLSRKVVSHSSSDDSDDSIVLYIG